MRPTTTLHPFHLAVPVAVAVVSAIVAGPSVPAGAIDPPPEAASPVDDGSLDEAPHGDQDEQDGLGGSDGTVDDPAGALPPAPDGPGIAPAVGEVLDGPDEDARDESPDESPDEAPAPGGAAEDGPTDESQPPEPRAIVQRAVADADGDGVPDESEPLLDADDDGRLDPVVHVQEAAAALLAVLADADGSGVPDPADEGWHTAVATVVDLYRSVAGPLLGPQPDADGDGIPDTLDGDGDEGVDLDADDDGRIDAFVEAQGVLVEAFGGHDADGDGIPDALDGGGGDEGDGDEDGNGGEGVDLDADDDGMIDVLVEAQAVVLDLVREQGVADLDADDDGVPDPLADAGVDPYERLAEDLATLFDELAGTGGVPSLDDDPENGVPDAADAGGVPDPYSTAEAAAVAIFDQLGEADPSLDLDLDDDGVPDGAQSDGEPSFETLRGVAVELLDTGGGGGGPDLDADDDGVPDGAQSGGEPSFETLRGVAVELLDVPAGIGEGVASALESAVDGDGDGYPDAAAGAQALAAPLLESGPDGDGDGVPDPADGDPEADDWGELHDTLLGVAATLVGGHDGDGDGVPDPADGDPERDDLDGPGSAPGAFAPVLALFADGDGDGIPAAYEPLLDADDDGVPDAAATARGETAGALDDLHGEAESIPTLSSPPSSTTTTTVPPTTTTTEPDDSEAPETSETSEESRDRDGDGSTAPAPGVSAPMAGAPATEVAGQRLVAAAPSPGEAIGEDVGDDGVEGDEPPGRELAVPAADHPTDPRGPAGWVQGLAVAALVAALGALGLRAHANRAHPPRP